MCIFCTATLADLVLSTIVGTEPGFVGAIKVNTLRVWYVFGSRTIARSLY